MKATKDYNLPRVVLFISYPISSSFRFAYITWLAYTRYLTYFTNLQIPPLSLTPRIRTYVMSRCVLYCYHSVFFLFIPTLYVVRGHVVSQTSYKATSCVFAYSLSFLRFSSTLIVSNYTISSLNFMYLIHRFLCAYMLMVFRYNSYSMRMYIHSTSFRLKILAHYFKSTSF